MCYSLLALLLISVSASAYAQVLPGDLLVNSLGGPDMLVHYRPDGTVVQTSGPGTGRFWVGAAILPNGNWVTTRRAPTDGVNIFEHETVVEANPDTAVKWTKSDIDAGEFGMELTI